MTFSSILGLKLFNDSIACREMGYDFGEPTSRPLNWPMACEDMPIWLENFYCMGHEIQLTECAHNPGPYGGSDHANDAYLHCFSDATSGELS